MGQRKIGIRTRNKVGTVIVQESFLHTFRHATEHSDNQLSTLTFQGIERLQAVDNLLFGVVTNGTRVQENGIRLIQ